MEEFKFKIWETVSKVGLGKQKHNESNNDADVVRQVFCVGLSDITKMEVQCISKKQIDRLGQAYRLKR